MDTSKLKVCVAVAQDGTVAWVGRADEQGRLRALIWSRPIGGRETPLRLVFEDEAVLQRLEAFPDPFAPAAEAQAQAVSFPSQEKTMDEFVLREQALHAALALRTCGNSRDTSAEQTVKDAAVLLAFLRDCEPTTSSVPAVPSAE